MSTPPASSSSAAAPPVATRDVFADNLDAEFALILPLVDRFPVIAMDTEFPGVVVKPLDSPDFNYDSIRLNVDLLHLLQLGLTLSDAAGNLPIISGRPSIWQFNFREFDVESSIYSIYSLDLLIRSGIDFNKNRSEGIDSQRFGELLVSSGMVLSDSVQWVIFHGASDFAYLIKLLTRQPELPASKSGFLELLKAFFPVLYDVKWMVRFANGVYGGLDGVATQLQVGRETGTQHQAGSDSLLTLRAFGALKTRLVSGDVVKSQGKVYGLD